MASKVDKKENLLKYFSEADVDSITEKLQEQVRLFSEDARQACAKWQVEYPEEFEAYVMEYLRELYSYPA